MTIYSNSLNNHRGQRYSGQSKWWPHRSRRASRCFVTRSPNTKIIQSSQLHASKTTNNKGFITNTSFFQYIFTLESAAFTTNSTITVCVGLFSKDVSNFLVKSALSTAFQTLTNHLLWSVHITCIYTYKYFHVFTLYLVSHRNTGLGKTHLHHSIY